MSHLTDYEIEQLFADARRADRALGTLMLERLTRLIQEQRELREQAGERERMSAEEVGG